MTPRRSLLVLAGLLALRPVRAEPASAVRAAQALVQATPAGRRAALLLPFADDTRSEWHYTPRRRDGVAWKAMSPAQREATTALLRTALNERGLDKVRTLMALEITLRQLEGSSASYRDPENYAVALYGEPGAAGWGWRIEGHHLSLHFSLAADRYVATLPQFFGANPATAPRSGARLLGLEEDLAREWLASLTPAQRSRAVFSTRPFGDIASRNQARAQPLDAVGLPFSDMNAAQQAQVLKLVTAFAEHLQPELAQARLARVQAAPLGTLRMGWAGTDKPGQPFYFRLQGERFLIEFDNSGGNHVHSVWRDFDGDFGRDVLGEHYRSDSHRNATRP